MRSPTTRSRARLRRGPCEIVLIGGGPRERTLTAVGPGDVTALAEATIDLRFIGVTVIGEKSAFINRTGHVIALGDASKLGRRSLVPVSPLSCIEELITDASVLPTEVEPLRKAERKITLARRAGTLGSVTGV